MPDIVIRIANSIQCCGECPCFHAEHPMNCQADTHKPRRTHGAPYAGKPDWCPLHELPPHGDLISKQAALAALYSDYAYAAMDVIEEVPVVVPAERRDET